MTPLALPGWADLADPSTLPPEAAGEAIIPFAHTTLADAESLATQHVQHHGLVWLMSLWPWVVGSLSVWSVAKQRTWDQRVETFTMPDRLWLPHVREAFHAGALQVPARLRPPARRSSGFPVLTDRQRAQAGWLAEQTAAAKMREWADGLKDDVRWEVVRAVREHWTAARLAQELRDRWRLDGVRWTRIASTELSMAYHDGLLSSIAQETWGYVAPLGDNKVCADCKRLVEGRHFRLLPAAPRDPTADDWHHALWPQKSNWGRAHKDWVPCLPVHPNCRHLLTVSPSQTPRETWRDWRDWSH